MSINMGTRCSNPVLGIALSCKAFCRDAFNASENEQPIRITINLSVPPEVSGATALLISGEP